jgi:Ca2+/Na+ antiporter
MKLKNEGQIILKQWAKMGAVVIALCLLAVSIYLISNAFSPKEKEKKALANYSYNSNINYKVYLKENKFFTSNYLGMNTQYISALIDYIEFNPRFNLKSDKDLNYTYTYQIVATAKGTYENSEGKSIDVWTKDYNILPQAEKTVTGKDISINETVKIKYDTYNDVLLDFRKQFGISINAEVDLALKVVVNAVDPSNSKIKFNENQDLTLVIPLLNATSVFKTNYSSEGTKTIYEEAEDSSDFNLISFIFGIVLLLISIYLLMISIKQLLSVTKKSEYVLEFNKILKEYSDIIAEAENIPDLSTYDIIVIKRFVDLVDIEEELHSPIICVEIRENESWFIILHDKTAYRYILKHDKFFQVNKDNI